MSASSSPFHLLRSKIVVRIYLFGLVQFAIVAAGLVFFSRQPHFSGMHDSLRFAADSIAAVSDHPAEESRQIARARDSLHVSVIVKDDHGDVLTQSSGDPPPESIDEPPPPPPPHSQDGPGAIDVPVQFPNGAHGVVTFSMPPRPPPPSIANAVLIVLVVVGISSWLIARSLASPLAKLAAATRAFGRGELKARVEMNRGDELGEVARAFDEMAARVAKALRGERELLANVSHELRTPLQRIHLALDIAAEGDTDTARESLADIAEDLRELEGLVDDVLMAARVSLDRGSIPHAAASTWLRREPVDLHDLVEKSVTRFHALNPTRVVATTFAEKLSLVSADRVLLRRVVDNLLSNAHKYTEDPKGEITVSVSEENETLLIVVKDHGEGIAKEDLERVFEPFFRVDRSRTRATGGLGLGLALSRGIVEAHGGKITIESKVGEGTEMKIELPALES